MRRLFVIVLVFFSVQCFGQGFGEYPDKPQKEKKAKNKKWYQEDVYPEDTVDVYTNMTPGDCLYKAGNNLAGAQLMSLLGAGCMLASSLPDFDPEAKKAFLYSGGGLYLVGVILYFRGSGFISLAGKKLNNKAELGITATPNGVGLALKF